MSLYRRLRPVVPFHFVEAGWSGTRRSYFVRAYDMTGRDVGIEPRTNNLIYERGAEADNKMSTLYDLVTCSWSLVQWKNEARTLEKLAVDPFIDVHDRLARAVQSQTDDDCRNEIRDVLMMVYGRSLKLDLRPPTPSN